MKLKIINKEDKQRIINTIVEAEKMTGGEIRVHIQRKCKEEVYAEAIKLFNRLKMYRTTHRNGVLIFVAADSRKFAIIGDHGIHGCAKDDCWQDVRDQMLVYFRKNQLTDAIVAGVSSVGKILQTYFPSQTHDKNELPDLISEN